MKYLSSLLACVFLMGAAAVCHADSYDYVFSGGMPVNVGGAHEYLSLHFTYLSPVLITQETTVIADTSMYYDPWTRGTYSDPLRIHFSPELNRGAGGLAVYGDHISFAVGFGSAYPSVSAFAIGDHGEFNVIDIPAAPASVSAVPEPSALCLLGTGLVAGVGALRRRISQ